MSLVVLALAGFIGLALPALQDGPEGPDQRAAWTPPATLATSARVPAAVTPAASPAPEEIIDAPAGAVLAWQEPAPATPSSIPDLAPLASATPPALTATPIVMAPAPARPQQRAVLALLAEPPPPATTAATPVGQPTPPATSTLAPPAQPAPPLRKPSTPATIASAARPKAAPSPTPLAAVRPSLAAPPAPPPAAPPARVLPPDLLAPPLDARLDGVVQFVWLPTSALPAGALYELVVWSPEQDPNQAWGVAPPVLTQSLWLNLDDLLRSGRFREGSLYWTVLVVQQDPYQRLTLPADSERRYLVLATGG